MRSDPPQAPKSPSRNVDLRGWSQSARQGPSSHRMERGAYRTTIEHALLIAHGVQFDPSLFHPSSFRPLSCLSMCVLPPWVLMPPGRQWLSPRPESRISLCITHIRLTPRYWRRRRSLSVCGNSRLRIFVYKPFSKNISSAKATLDGGMDIKQLNDHLGIPGVLRLKNITVSPALSSLHLLPAQPFICRAHTSPTGSPRASSPCSS